MLMGGLGARAGGLPRAGGLLRRYEPPPPALPAAWGPRLWDNPRQGNCRGEFLGVNSTNKITNASHDWHATPHTWSAF